MFIGCTFRNDPQIISLNKNNLSGHGEYIGTLPDGRKVNRYEIEMGSGVPNHWLYVTDGSITVNRTVRQGKTSVNQVDIIIEKE